MKGLSLLIILLVIGGVAYLLLRDKRTPAMAEGEEAITKSSLEAALMSALQDLRIRF